MYFFLKRVFDIILSLTGIVVLAVPMLIISLLIVCTSRGGVFFLQNRVGKNKKHFKLIKFRTMRRDAPRDIPTHLFVDSCKYITGIGKFLRRTSLDELPQIFNIFVGQMSIIGPRPALYNQYDLIAERDKYNANSVRPGLTGLAQVSGRDELEIPVKAALDGKYIKTMSLWTDIKIFFKTFFAVLKKDGVKEGASTLPSDAAEVVQDSSAEQAQTDQPTDATELTAEAEDRAVKQLADAVEMAIDGGGFDRTTLVKSELTNGKNIETA